jgi:hypothetical protein
LPSGRLVGPTSFPPFWSHIPCVPGGVFSAARTCEYEIHAPNRKNPAVIANIWIFIGPSPLKNLIVRPDNGAGRPKVTSQFREAIRI